MMAHGTGLQALLGIHHEHSDALVIPETAKPLALGMPRAMPTIILTTRPTVEKNIIITADKNSPFARVAKSMLNDPNISWQAKGILADLLGKPTNWKVRIQDLVNRSRNGESSVRSILKELEVSGYVKLTKIRDNQGKFVEWNWQVSDSPIFRESCPDSDFPQVEIRHSNKKDQNKKIMTKDVSSRQPFVQKPEAAGDLREEYAPKRKPITGTKEEQLARIRPPTSYPSEEEFENFLDFEDLHHIQDKRPELYEWLCEKKWRHWEERRWRPIRDWQTYVLRLNEKMDDATRSR